MKVFTRGILVFSILILLSSCSGGGGGGGGGPVDNAGSTNNNTTGEAADYTANGTYIYNSSAKTLTLSFDKSTSPEINAGEIDTRNITSLTATTMLWDDPNNQEDDMDFTRQSGSSTDITGIWTYIDSDTGDKYVLTLNSDKTFSLEIFLGDEQPGSESADYTASGTYIYNPSAKTLTLLIVS